MEETVYPMDLSKSNWKSSQKPEKKQDDGDEPTDLSLKSFSKGEDVSIHPQHTEQKASLISEIDCSLDVSQPLAKNVHAASAVDSCINAEHLDDNAVDESVTSVPDKSLPFVDSSADIQSIIGEESNISTASRDEEISDRPETPKNIGVPKSEKRRRKPQRRGDLSMVALNGSEIHDFGADKLYEYQWPQEGKGEWYMLQEQVSDFLGVKSFKRKYPDLERRGIEPDERTYLREKAIVTEMQCDLGLTAIRADLVHDLMSKDYPHKYKEFAVVLKERKKQQTLERQRELLAQKNDKSKIEVLKKKAVKSASEYNAMFNRNRKDERRAYFDIHSFEVQYPKNKFKVLPKEMTKMGSYPVAVIPGQFQDYYKSYTPAELRYMPMNTAMYSSPRKFCDIYADPKPFSDNESDEEASHASGGEESDAGEARSLEAASEEEPGDEEETVSQASVAAKANEQTKSEVDTKVPSYIDKLKEREGTPKRGRGRSSAKSSGASTPVEEEGTRRKRGRRAANNDDDEPATPAQPDRARTPKRQKRILKEVEKEKERECSLCNRTEPAADDPASADSDPLVQCAQCKRYGHAKCLELTSEMVTVIKTYPWQCMECKSCVKCKDPQHEDKMLFCDHCDRGYHTFCVGLLAIPNGRWECPSCRPSAPQPAPAASQSISPQRQMLAGLDIQAKLALLQGRPIPTPTQPT